ncbi:poly [adp-ribose] polymerase 1 [Quercus suber]|uniref:Poly [ADP-ribose] polymerase n=1 Tax=Quercus suber TaxID=58331 RepID=A0AAW0KJV4_QUESU
MELDRHLNSEDKIIYAKVTSTKVEIQENKELLQQSTSKAGVKRKKEVSGDQKPKAAKAIGDMSASTAACMENVVDSRNEHSKASDLESKLETQTKELWALKDDLKKYVSTAELREMLEANGQDADGMMFGALATCPICSGSLCYSGGMYRCRGFLSAWSKCSYSTREPERLKGKWKVPEETNNQYLSKWFRSQKGTKPVRILPTSSSNNPSGSQATNSPSQSTKSESLGDLREEFKRKIEGAGGLVHTKIKKDTNCLVVNGVLDDQNAETRKARRMKLPIVREDYLADCIKRQKKLPFDLYKVEAIGEASSMVTVKVKGRSAVHESSGLQDTDCYVFRKWGRVGNEKIGGSKLEEMSKSDAIREFKRLFLEKTGNPWEAWEKKQNFQKQPGRFFPLDIDYGVNKQVSKKRQNDAESKLAPAVVELMKMLFNALTEIQNLLNSNAHNPSVKESLIVDASNRFFTVIPSIHPHIIRDEDDFKSKVKMLEALQDIEIASRLVGFDADNDDSLDEKYMKLHCDVAPLPHDSEDYRLIEKYLLTTHAPTHTVGILWALTLTGLEWSLELEEVFSLEREGEFDKFAPYREKLKNRMLLWHGVYFADLVSKSAQYCFTDKKNPVGLMLLSEVALGEIYELKKAKYMDKPPEGKHSTKGLGKNIPLESEYVKWRDDIVVPCGKPVPSKVKASELMYNEYIVYNTAQVKMQFLLKVRFHHKR